MATATAIQIPQRQECNALEGQIAQLKLKLTDSETELGKLKKELSTVAEAIALDREKPEKINDVSRKIEQCEARINGFRSVIAAKDEEIRKLAPEAQLIEAENLLAARRQEFVSKRTWFNSTASAIASQSSAILARHRWMNRSAECRSSKTANWPWNCR